MKVEKINPIIWLYDRLFPPPAVCPICMQSQQHLQVCDACRDKALRQRSTYGQCKRCCSFGVYSGACRNCREWPRYYQGNFALWPYQAQYKRVIQEFKFQNMPWLADALAEALLPFLPPNYDLLVPVPLHPARLAERGYNQSELLVRALSRKSGLPWENSILRVRDTPHQTGLSRAERLENLHNTFACSKTNTVKHKNIILIDDVFTTGTTLLSCAKVLHQQGVKAVVSCTLTSGQGRF